MAILTKKQMSEEDIKLNYITPAIQSGWTDHITMETKITDGKSILVAIWWLVVNQSLLIYIVVRVVIKMLNVGII